MLLTPANLVCGDHTNPNALDCPSCGKAMTYRAAPWPNNHGEHGVWHCTNYGCELCRYVRTPVNTTFASTELAWMGL